MSGLPFDPSPGDMWAMGAAFVLLTAGYMGMRVTGLGVDAGEYRSERHK